MLMGTPHSQRMMKDSTARMTFTSVFTAGVGFLPGWFIKLVALGLIGVVATLVFLFVSAATLIYGAEVNAVLRRWQATRFLDADEDGVGADG